MDSINYLNPILLSCLVLLLLNLLFSLYLFLKLRSTCQTINENFRLVKALLKRKEEIPEVKSQENIQPDFSWIDELQKLAELEKQSKGLNK